jgi:hypothetical protein
VIETSLLLSASDATGPASFDYFLKELTMPFEVHVNGADRPAHAFSDPRVIEFPSPFGPRSAYLFPFSDQVLYPRTMALTPPCRLYRACQAGTIACGVGSVGAVRLVAQERVRNVLAKRRSNRARTRPPLGLRRVDVIRRTIRDARGWASGQRGRCRRARRRSLMENEALAGRLDAEQVINRQGSSRVCRRK